MARFFGRSDLSKGQTFRKARFFGWSDGFSGVEDGLGISKFQVGNLGNFATLEGERNLRVRKDTSCIHMIVEKEPPISFDFAMLVNIGTKCPSLESLMLVDCRLVKFCGQEGWRRRAYLTSLKNLVFQWCAAGDGRPRGGRCRKTLQFEWAWELWIGRLAILAPALRTLCFLDCFDSSLGKV